MIILVGIAYQVDDDVENGKDAVLEALKTELPFSEAMQPLKVWASDEPDNSARCAEIHYLNMKAQTDPNFGWTVQGKELQDKALQEAAEEVIEQTVDPTQN
jgi:hypothetical protein